ncbi:MAG: class II fructose-1,6-bisphosphate aldolase [bacterium]
MGLVSLSKVLLKAKERGYAVGAFNFVNMEVVQGILDAAVEAHAPVIIQTTEGAIEYAGIEYLSAMAKVAVEKAGVDVVLHLDHGKHLDTVLLAIKHGYTSVMIDASDKPYEENLSITKEVVKIAHAVGVSVEAELGKLKGIEDTVSVKDADATLIDPDEAKDFVIKTGVDALAPAIGTSHGAFKFKGTPRLDLDRLEHVAKLTGIPLVLHGASSVPQDIIKKANNYGANIKGAAGVPDDIMKQAIKKGICKVNTDTDLRLCFTASIREELHNHPEVFDLREILGPARQAVKNMVLNRIKVFGCAGAG